MALIRLGGLRRTTRTRTRQLGHSKSSLQTSLPDYHQLRKIDGTRGEGGSPPIRRCHRLIPCVKTVARSREKGGAKGNGKGFLSSCPIYHPAKDYYYYRSNRPAGDEISEEEIKFIYRISHRIELAINFIVGASELFPSKERHVADDLFGNWVPLYEYISPSLE